jgi:hypothetical protein
MAETKGQVGHSFLAELPAQGLACVMKVDGYHFFPQDVLAGRAAFRASTRHIGGKLEAACATARIEKPDS